MDLGTDKARYYRFATGDQNGYVFERVDQVGFSESFTLAEFEEIEASSGYSFDREFFEPAQAKARLMSDTYSFALIPDAEKPKIVWRLEWVQRYLKKESANQTTRSDASMRAIIAEIAIEMAGDENLRAASQKKKRAGTLDTSRQPPSVKTLRGWVTDFEEGGFSPTALRDNYRHCGRTPVIPDADLLAIQLRNAARFCTENRPTKISLYTDYLNEVNALNAIRLAAGGKTVRPCCDKTFYRCIRELPEYTVDAGRFGIEFARNKYYPVSTGLHVTRPGQRIEIDEWKVSLQTLLVRNGVWATLSPEMKAAVERARWYLSAAIDTASQCILAMRLAPEANHQTAIATLAMIVADKGTYADAAGALTPWDMRCGLELIVTDQGSAYIAEEFRAAVLGCGGSVMTPPAKLAQMRATVERLFGTLHTRLLTRFTGRSFHNVVALGEYPSQERASLTIEDLARALVRFVVDAYHNTRHAGLRGETPRDAWRRLVREHGYVPAPIADVRRTVFGIKVTRALTTKGVRFLNIFYQSLELQEVRRKHGDCSVEVAIDPDNLGFVSVRAPGDSSWRTVPSIAPGFDKMNMADWIATLEDLRRRYSAAAELTQPIVLAAYAAIQKISDSAVRRADIGSTMLTAEELNLAERRLLIAWAPPADPRAPEEPDDADLATGMLNDAIDAPPSDATPPTKPDASSKTNTWKLEKRK